MRPGTETELAEAIRGANGPLSVRGGGTRGVGRAAPGEVLETGGLSGITLYEPGALTLVARAGTPLAEIDAALSAEGQRLPFEVPDLRGLLGTAGASTIGGVVAANASGPRRVQAGACRDSLIGVRFVDGTGTIIKNGGRVMKNVTGYDLVKLLAGSRGTLGVLTEVSFKVLPAPAAQATLVARGLDAGAAVAAMSRALGSPYEVTGAAHLDAGGAAQTLLRIEGMDGSVTYRRGALATLMGAGWTALEAEESRAAWAGVRDVAPLAGRAGAVWRIAVKPSEAPAVLAALRAGGADVPAVIDWGGALIWALLPGMGADAAAALRATVTARSGHATLWRPAPGMEGVVPVFHPEPAPIAALATGLRARFDPRGILNPGLM